MGDGFINDNEIRSGDAGIYFYTFDFGYFMYDSSNATIGSLEIINNTINATDDGYGIYSFWWYEFGSSLYDTAYVEVGDCLITNNTITTWGSSSYGIDTGPYYAAYYVYDDAQAYFGDYVVANNDIFADGNYGIYFFYYSMGDYLKPFNFAESHAIVEFGDALISTNNITVPNGDGIYFDGEYVGYYLYNDSSVTTDNIRINENTIASSDEALYVYLSYFGYELSDNSTFTMGNITLNDNTINITNSGDGVYLYTYDYFLTEVYDTASALRGFLLIDGNMISNASHGIYVKTTDNFTISCNYVHDNDHGIYLNTSSNNTVIYNLIVNNSAPADTGVHVDANSFYNELHNNCFFNNSPQAIDEEITLTNNWTGNFWDDWVGGSYPIDGAANNNDSNPLDECPIKANVTATKVAVDMNGPPVLPWEVICYTIWINNTGNCSSADNSGNEFEDSIPDYTTYNTGSADSSSGTIEYNDSTNMIIWNGAIPANRSVELTFCVTVDLAVPPGTNISNQGTVNYDSNCDRINDAQKLTDDPATAAPDDPTEVITSAAPQPVQAPAVTPIGLIALVGLLSLIATVTITRRKRQ
jgi:uncharacterized repeat protein (TIGR01451 family)